MSEATARSSPMRAVASAARSRTRPSLSKSNALRSLSQRRSSSARTIFSITSSGIAFTDGGFAERDDVFCWPETALQITKTRVQTKMLKATVRRRVGVIMFPEISI